VIPVLSPDEASALDRAAEGRGIGVSALMERAGFELASAALDLGGGAYGRRFVVVCGKGNNGGDGWVAARVLANAGAAVTVVALADAGDGPAAEKRALASRSTVRVRALEALDRELARSDVVVDAIFGTGFGGVAEGAFAEAIGAVVACERPVVAADIPSGVAGATGAVEGAAVRADVTVTFGAPKLGNVLLPGAALGGVLEIADIGFPPDLVRSDVGLVERADVAAWLPARRLDTHKRDAGYAVVVGGSSVMAGAVTLSTASAYRAGAGLVAFAVPEPILRVVQEQVREAVAIPLPATDAGSTSGGSDRLDDVLEQADALAIGPGMTTADATASFVRDLVRRARVPVVVDADGLNAFVGRIDELASAATPIVLTPHGGEFARLAGTDAADVERDRIGAARRLAARTGCVVLLKGSRTVIAEPGGSVRINATGGPFLATGGTGDVLTGVIAGFLARGVEPFDAASGAAYVHGLAGTLAAEASGDGTTAGDVSDRVARAIVEVTEG
jgi:ADP-dependent NAD(P)H-hydrate dehydratase / NAD(P)H-hydrate epimerase